MFNTLKDRFGTKFLAHGKTSAGAQRIPVADGVTITTSNPQTYSRLTGQQVKDTTFKKKARKQGTARPVNTGLALA